MKKNILLVGGSYGIGSEIASRLAADHNVWIASRSNDNIPERVKHLTFDVNQDSIGVLELPDKIHGFVYCPGSINLRPFKMLKPENFEEDLRINFLGLVKVLHEIMPNLLEAQGASLVFFSTVAVDIGMPFHTSVAAAKAAVEGFARALAAEYAPKLRVNVIAPSITDTPLADKLLASEEKKVKLGKRHPMQRVGNTRDIASTACFLLDDDASWITGQVIGVDGGLSTLNVN